MTIRNWHTHAEYRLSERGMLWITDQLRRRGYDAVYDSHDDEIIVRGTRSVPAWLLDDLWAHVPAEYISIYC